MPLNAPSLATGFIAPNFASTGFLGASVPQLSMGVASGVSLYFSSQAIVTSIDAGTLGVGTTVMPFLLPSALLQGNMTTSFASFNLLGTYAATFLLGLSNGIALGLNSLALLQINHPTVGVGTGTAKIIGPSSVPTIQQGLVSNGLTGTWAPILGAAIGTAIDISLASYFQIVPIVGTGSPVGGSGVGLGTVI